VLGARPAEDEGVEDDDVRHREEGHQAAAELAPRGRAALGDPEEAVEPARRRPGAACVVLGGLPPRAEESHVLVPFRAGSWCRPAVAGQYSIRDSRTRQASNGAVAVAVRSCTTCMLRSA